MQFIVGPTFQYWFEIPGGCVLPFTVEPYIPECTMNAIVFVETGEITNLWVADFC